MHTITFNYKHGIKNIHSIIILLISFTIANAQNGVGVNTTTPKSNFEVYGSFGQKVTTVSSNTTLDETYSLVICNNGASAISITLPDATACLGRIYTIKRNATSTANVTIAGTIDGITNLVLKFTNDAATLFSNGTNWSTKNSYMPQSSWNLAGNTATDPANDFIGTTDAQPFILKTSGVERLRVLSGGNIGIGVTAPTAYLHLMAGSTAAGTAPLKFTTQAAGLTAVEQGTMELIGNSLQFTQLLKRRGVAMTQSVRTSDYTLAASSGSTESAAIETAQHGANYLEIGKMEEIVLRGTVSQRSNANAKLTLRVRIGPPGSEATVQTVSTNATSLISANTPFELRVSATCRTIGATGTVQFNTIFWVDNILNTFDNAVLALNINTTVANNIIVTAQWGTDNDVANTITVNQARVLCIEPNR